MKNIRGTVGEDHVLLLLKERDRLGHCLDEKRMKRLELETAKRQATDEDVSVIQDHINRLLLEIEVLQIDYLNIYKQTSHLILDSYTCDPLSHRNKRSIPSYVPPGLSDSGDVVLKALDNLLIEGVCVTAGESFLIESMLARKLIEAGRVIVDERYILN